jgi:cytochrome c-type biogenesis protein CcsB
MKNINRIITFLFSTTASGLYILLFAISIGVATFIENDFGTSAAQKVVYKTFWFEALLVLFGLSVVFNVFRFKLISQKKWAVFSFHMAIIVILAGAAVTRYLGSEGMMHIREGSSSNSILSADTYLQYKIRNDEETYAFKEPVLFASLGNNQSYQKYKLGDDLLEVRVSGFIPNPAYQMNESEDGYGIIQVVFGGAQGRNEYLLKEGEFRQFNGVNFQFGNQFSPGAVNIAYRNDSLLIKVPQVYSQTVMATREKSTLTPGSWYPLQLRSLYTNGRESFVFGQFQPNGKLTTISTSRKMQNSSFGGVRMELAMNGQKEEVTVIGAKGMEGQPSSIQLGDYSIDVSYGASRVYLPFSIELHDFVMERYPGTNSAMSYASQVTLVDPNRGIGKSYNIHMNHILNYGGYRFFQSSYDNDELGTYLSVNHDAPGTIISYFGYFLLTLGFILTLVHPRSRFQELSKSFGKMHRTQKTLACIAMLALMNPLAQANDDIPPPASINKDHAVQFGQMVVQDFQGRLKPMNTFTNEVLRKVSKKEMIAGLRSEQVILGMIASPDSWKEVPMIKLGEDEAIQELLQTQDDLVAYNVFFDFMGRYKLLELVKAAYEMADRDRGMSEKQIIKLDERVNICSMIYSGSMLRLFPLPGDPNNTWISPRDLEKESAIIGLTELSPSFFEEYKSALSEGLENNSWINANTQLSTLKYYQESYGGEVMLSQTKINAEILLNKMRIFSRLAGGYGLLGLWFLVILFVSIFMPSVNLKWMYTAGFVLFIACFLLQTFGLGLRWYVSGRAPWSNGYESMIYIAWTSALAGLIFGRKSAGTLTATSVLTATILLVAGMSWFDPEITPLVPVLRSYWLTIHVSLVAGSYGFLMLGAIVGVLNLIFMVLLNSRNRENIMRVIRELTTISEMTLIGGLIMIAIGTYLGGIWANESWGRYWGWDAKETWALVTILVYAFILHMRFIPGMRGLFAFNVATLFGWASVMMTYFGVNFYLSGLHSYAAGDPVPIPSFVYITAIVLTVISMAAFFNFRRQKSF